jgi:ADP-dependent phosphofructokinase/glucokinase
VTDLLVLIRAWNRRLGGSLEPEVPGEGVLTGFSATIDRVLILNADTDSAYLNWKNAVPSEPGSHQFGGDILQLDEGEIRKRIEEELRQRIAEDHSKSYDHEIGVEVEHRFWPWIESAIRAKVDGTIQGLLNGTPGTQERSQNRGPQHQVLDQLFSKDIGVKVLLGGAAASVADVLAELGMTARIHTTWWPSEYADLISDRAERVVIEEDGLSSSIVAAKAGEVRHPWRISYVFQVQKNEPFSGKTPPKTERQIYTVIQPWAPNDPITTEVDGITQPFAGWPAYRRFVAVGIDGENRLKIREASDEQLRCVAREHRYVLLSGLANDAFELQLESHLTVLVESGCCLHLEISGDFFQNEQAWPDDERDRQLKKAKSKLDAFMQSVRRIAIQSISLNDEQVGQLGRFQLLNGASAVASKDVRLKDLISLAEEFARQLGVERLYLHTNSADVVLRRNATPGTMRQEIQADLFAKGALLAALYRRHNPRGWQGEISKVAPVLLLDGFKNLIEVAEGDEFLLNHGYRLSKPSGAYSLAVVPVMWPDSPPAITSSAGDISSAVQYVFAGV